MSRLITKAFEVAAKAHMKQKRIGGHPYIVHPFRVCELLRSYYSTNDDEDVLVLVAAILHDVIEDTDVPYDDIVKNFGTAVANLVVELTNDEDQIKQYGRPVYFSQKMKRMSSSALMIKLADRLDNVTSLKKVCNNWSDKYRRETGEILKELLDPDKGNSDPRLTMYPHSDLIGEIRRTLEEYDQIRKAQKDEAPDNKK